MCYDVCMAHKTISLDLQAYDALRSRRIYKAGETHADAVRMMLEQFPGHFDPRLIELFARIHERFRDVFDDCGD